MEHTHRLLETLIARRDRAPRQRFVERQVVEIGVGRVREVGDGVGEAVHGRVRILETARGVDRCVGQHGEIGFHNDRVAKLIVLPAVVVRHHVGCEGVHVLGAKSGIGCAGGIQDLGDAHEGLLGIEE